MTRGGLCHGVNNGNKMRFNMVNTAKHNQIVHFFLLMCIETEQFNSKGEWPLFKKCRFCYVLNSFVHFFFSSLFFFWQAFLASNGHLYNWYGLNCQKWLFVAEMFVKRTNVAALVSERKRGTNHKTPLGCLEYFQTWRIHNVPLSWADVNI